MTGDATPMSVEDGPLRRAARGETIDGYELSIVTPNTSERRWLSVTARPLRDDSAKVTGAVGVIRDITEQKRLGEELRSLSLVDDLTGLYNRRGFMALAEQHARVAARTKSPFGILFCDLNGLKKINDTLGHDVGDHAIREAARALKGTFRESDVIARLGGDEFVVLLTNASSVESLDERLRELLEARNDREPRYRLSMSSGAAFSDPAHPRPLQDLLAEADQRMYARKRDARTAPALRLVRA